MSIPLEIYGIIISSLDAKSIVSYITTKKDIYRKALHDHFWISLNHETFQNVFYYVALYGYNDIMEAMLRNVYHTIDDRFLNKVHLYMALNGNIRELKIISDHVANDEINEINIVEEISSLIQLVEELIDNPKNSFKSGELDSLLKRLGEYYYEEFLLRSIIKRLGTDQLNRLIGRIKYFPYDFNWFFVGELVYFNRFDNVKRIIESRIAEQSSEYLALIYGDTAIFPGIFYGSIIKYASLDFYLNLYKEINEGHTYNRTLELNDKLEFTTNPDLYEYLLDLDVEEKDMEEKFIYSRYEYILLTGYGLDPYIWLNLIKEKGIRLSPRQVKILLNDAEDHGFTYFHKVIEKHKNKLY